GRGAKAAAQGDDGDRHHGGAAPAAVEHRHRRGRDEADRRPDGGGPHHLVRAGAARLSCAVRDLEAAVASGPRAEPEGVRMSIRTIGSSARVVAWLLAVAACDGGPASRSGSTRGVVVAVNRDAGEITLDHEAVPGLMEAMKMPF